jgi:riboflavin synthase
MFTGIIIGLGRILKIEPYGDDKRMLITTDSFAMNTAQLGESIAVNGVCLTAVDFTETGFWVDVSSETLRCTSLAQATTETRVNLERALLPTTRLSGHFVSGHVDGVARVMKITPEARSKVFVVEVPEGLMRYIAAKGSVCVDGVSLTVNTVTANTCSVNIIPHTAKETLFHTYAVGSHVNIEVDLLARYVLNAQ